MRRIRVSGIVAAVVLAGCAATPPPRGAAPADPLHGLLVERGVLATPPAAHAKSGDIVLAAMNFLDRPYARGGTGADHPTRGGFDCSGFTRHVYAVAAGVALPRTAQEQALAAGLAEVATDALQPGDLVFFNTLRRPYSHVGIYVGGGRFVHAPRPGADVRVESLRTSYWAPRFDGARRVAAATVSARPSTPAPDAP